ncbi:flavin reductase family protein [Ferrimonas marina]|uniref:NADH oxidoreductase Hcr n=1 Tax=Ferrimonas marina TaxID=299255 RepID=A0A1M5RWA6_9GAMM|nr:iron-sulfur cluster-binding domain-containing protein [Ferrimonas marina]SHH30083.1 NADH oxidoreductase Hcr [Ferrimonas marina]
MQLTCVGVAAETADVTRFTFMADTPVSFEPGQFVSLKVPIGGRTSVRAYSLSSVPGESRLQMAIKRVPGGRVSNHLLDHLKQGDQLEALPPAGHFTSTQAGSGPWLLMAAGCGITPLFSMLRDRLQREPEADVVLLFSVRDASHRLFARELEFLAQRYPKFQLHWRFSAEQGRLDGEQLAQLVTDVAARSVMICGPEGYMSDAEAMTRSLGAERVHCEAFHTQTSALDSADTSSGHTLAVDGIELPILPGQTVLDSLEAGGIPILAACRTGVCGSCKCQGEKDKLQTSSTMGLSEEEIEQGYFLACSSTVTGDMSLEWED